jgi:hypothetical protein
MLAEASVMLPGADIREWAAINGKEDVVGNLPTHLVKGHSAEMAETLFLREYEKLTGTVLV